jgi:hypothetical protein
MVTVELGGRHGGYVTSFNGSGMVLFNDKSVCGAGTSFMNRSERRATYESSRSSLNSVWIRYTILVLDGFSFIRHPHPCLVTTGIPYTMYSTRNARYLRISSWIVRKFFPPLPLSPLTSAQSRSTSTSTNGMSDG